MTRSSDLTILINSFLEKKWHKVEEILIRYTDDKTFFADAVNGILALIDFKNFPTLEQLYAYLIQVSETPCINTQPFLGQIISSVAELKADRSRTPHWSSFASEPSPTFHSTPFASPSLAPFLSTTSTQKNTPIIPGPLFHLATPREAKVLSSYVKISKASGSEVKCSGHAFKEKEARVQSQAYKEAVLEVIDNEIVNYQQKITSQGNFILAPQRTFLDELNTQLKRMMETPGFTDDDMIQYVKLNFQDARCDELLTHYLKKAINRIDPDEEYSKSSSVPPQRDFSIKLDVLEPAPQGLLSQPDQKRAFTFRKTLVLQPQDLPIHSIRSNPSLKIVEPQVVADESQRETSLPGAVPEGDAAKESSDKFVI